MNAVFKIHAYCHSTDLVDFVLVTFKPTKVEIDTAGFSSSEYTFTLTGMEAVSPTSLEKELKDFLERKGQKVDADFIKMYSIELTDLEKKRIDSIITYGKFLPHGPGKAT